MRRNAEESGIVPQDTLALKIAGKAFTRNAGDSFYMPRGQVR